MLQLCVLLKDRKLNRLNGYDYSREGWYFVTIDCLKMYPWFGKIMIVGTGQCPVRTDKINNCPIRTTIKLNDLGLVAEKYWKNISNVYNDVVLDKFVIMPNHVHGIIQVVGTGQCPVRTRNEIGQCPVRTDNNNPYRYGKLSKIINGYKNIVTKEIRSSSGENEFAWQRSFYDEIIRNENSLQRIRKYIIENPKNFLKSKL